MRKFKIVSINVSDKKGEKKRPVPEGVLQENYGIIGDAHAGDWHRQVSLLAEEDINTMIEKGAKVSYGDFAENLTTEGIDLAELPIGTNLYIGETILEVTQIGKECHSHCLIFQQVGDCVMPKKGIFTKVLKGGVINNESNCYYNI
ncbi:MAG: molybdenum cofactor sulfurase [Candidatus Melainabacteria bacterium RIFOXYA12_FULL_32_12]|nr:MAG: molybdenum cofactor sulfurase [Candidatus Melainabacteria bacterium RIFOXYA12_FULL_32_12]